jgi:polyisoprenyl-phosphate glycosyltransferase
MPLHREEINLRRMYERLEVVTSALSQLEWQYVCVNDGGSDSSILVSRQLAAEDSKVKVIDLSTNFGKEIALTVGGCEIEDVDAVIFLMPICNIH